MNATESIAETASRICGDGRKGPRTLLPIPSPCVAVCKMDVNGALCTGCLRTIPEITAWSRLDDPAKLAIWALIDGRAQAPALAATP